MRTIEKLWEESPELHAARTAWNSAGRARTEEFLYSREFRNARLAFRRRMNNSPNSETT